MDTAKQQTTDGRTPSIANIGLCDSGLRRTPNQNSIIYVSVPNVGGDTTSCMHSTLARIAGSLAGPVRLVPLKDGDFYLSMTGWTLQRAVSVARLIEALLRSTESRKPLSRGAQISLFSISGDGVDTDELLERAKVACERDENISFGDQDIVRIGG